MICKFFFTEIKNSKPSLWFSVFSFSLLMPWHGVNAQENEVDWSLDLGVGQQQQTFSNATAKLSSFSLTPSLTVNNWNLFVSLPWYRVKGDYFLEGNRPKFVTLCNRLNSLTSARKTLLVNNGIVTQQQVNNCAAFQAQLDDLNKVNSGLGDVSGFVQRLYELESDGTWSMTAGLGYKSDSGDVDLGLGTGTQDAMLEVGVNMQTEKNFLNAMLGYNLIVADEEIDDLYQSKNYAYASIDFSRSLTKWFSLGANWSAQQAYIEGEEATKFIRVYADFLFMPEAALRLYTSRYLGTENVPNSEAGVELSYRF
jgi:hypothetical protein